MAFKLQVLIEPKDGIYCGDCPLWRKYWENEVEFPHCALWGETGEDALRREECIAAELASKDS